MFCDSPTELDASNDDNNILLHSATVTRCASPDSTTTPSKKDRSASWTFGRTPSLSAPSLAAVWTRRRKDKADTDPCPTPKSILKRTSTNTSEAGSVISGTSHTSNSSRPGRSPRRKRVTWIDPDVPPAPIPVRVGKNIRRHSADAVDRVAKVASNLASMAASIPLPRRQMKEYEYYWSDSEDEGEVREPMPDIDWVAYGRAYTEEDARRDFPPLLPDEYVGDEAASSGTSTNSVARRSKRSSRAAKAVARGSEDNSDDCHWDARLIDVPTWLIEGKYRPKSDRLAFEEDDADVRAALRLPHNRPPSVAAGLRVSSQLELLSSPESSASFDSEMVVTPSASMLLPPASPSPGDPDTAEMPDGAVVLVPKPVRVWPRPPYRAYTGVSDVAGSVLTASMIVSSVLVACVSIAAAA